MLTKGVVAGFAFLLFGGILAVASLAVREDEPAYVGIVAGGLGLLAVLVGTFAGER